MIGNFTWLSFYSSLSLLRNDLVNLFYPYLFTLITYSYGLDLSIYLKLYLSFSYYFLLLSISSFYSFLNKFILSFIILIIDGSIANSSELFLTLKYCFKLDIDLLYLCLVHCFLFSCKFLFSLTFSSSFITSNVFVSFNLWFIISLFPLYFKSSIGFVSLSIKSF